MNPRPAHVLIERARLADDIREAADVDHGAWLRLCREVRMRVDKGLGLPNGRGAAARAIAISMAASDELLDDHTRSPARDLIVGYLQRHGCTSKHTGARPCDIVQATGRTATAIHNAIARLYEAGVIRKTFDARCVIWLRDSPDEYGQRHDRHEPISGRLIASKPVKRA